MQQFHKKVRENEEFNQYWYSKKTVESILEEVFSLSDRLSRPVNVAFLSTPSLYFCLQQAWGNRTSQIPVRATLFDFDESLGAKICDQFVKYDFRKPRELSEDLMHAFDCVIVDPPFITEEVWRSYAETARFLLPKGSDCDPMSPGGSSPVRFARLVGTRGLFIGTSVIENADLLKELFDAHPTPFLPSIPNLVYQYNLFTNFRPKSALAESNPEISC